MESNSLLQRYRCDRRKLLEFLLSSGLVSELRTGSGPPSSLSASDLDGLSADYVIECVKSGGIVDVLKGTERRNLESPLPISIHSESGDCYFLVSSPDRAGSPPRRMPPTPFNKANTYNDRSGESCHVDSSNITTSGNNYVFPNVKPVKPNKIIPLGLPALRTGLSDDDLRETAYEIMVASLLLSGFEAFPAENRKKEKSAKLLSSLKRRDKPQLQTQFSDRHLELINTIRVQMQISSKMEACIRRNLVQLAAMRTGEQIDLPQLALGLLVGIFKSDFPNEKLYMNWKNRQANILEELLCFSPSLEKNEQATVRKCLAKIRDSKEWDVVMSPSLRVEVLSSIRQVASKLSSLPGQFGIQEETYYWSAAYYLNIRLYEKLVFGIFDVLDEGQLIEEAAMMVFHIRSIWSTLGINQKLHDVIYGWVLFQQFVFTGEHSLLGKAVQELQKVNYVEEGNTKEDLYINHLICSRQISRTERSLSLWKAIFHSVSVWCDDKLQDYHLHFGQKPHDFQTLMSLASTVGLPAADSTEIKLVKLETVNDDAGIKIRTYIRSSIEAACARAVHSVNMRSQGERSHALALLANELRSISKAEINVFVPIFSRWLPECMMISATLLHRFYGERLEPFIKGVSSLSGDARQILPAAYMLDDDLTQLYNSGSKSKLHKPFTRKLKHYQIEEVVKPVMLDWLISQHDLILEWTGRAFDLEAWEPLSSHQRHAASIVEVFRIIEETVSQLFGLNLPMDLMHLQALLSVIYHSLEAYLQRILDQLVDKMHLYPSAPPLTRFTDAVMPIMKRKSLEFTGPDNKVLKKLDELTISKLCIRLNTLRYIQKQISATEDNIRKSWALVRPSREKASFKETSEGSEENSLTHSEAVDELFVTTFDSLRDTTANCVNKTCELIGARAVFWDLRDIFVVQLYRGTVEGARLESLLPHVDSVLDNICGLLEEDLRDMVVLSICRATLEAYVRVLLDGGPTRAFSDSDIPLMEEDLAILKEFFIADGEGLPRSLIEQEAKLAEQILDLYSLESEMLIQMLMTASVLISMGVSSQQQGQTRRLEDAHTLVRVLCHKKDREASKFLKRQYELPMSSEYEDGTVREAVSNLPAISELMRSTSSRWSKSSQSSFKSIKQKIQAAASDFRSNSAW